MKIRTILLLLLVGLIVQGCCSEGGQWFPDSKRNVQNKGSYPLIDSSPGIGVPQRLAYKNGRWKREYVSIHDTLRSRSMSSKK